MGGVRPRRAGPGGQPTSGATLPVGVTGMAWTKLQYAGVGAPTSGARQKARNSPDGRSSTGLSRMTAASCSPHFWSGTPTTATSATAGCVCSSSSISARVDVDPAADDHVLEPPGDLDEAPLVHAAQVAHVQPVAGVDHLPRGVRHLVVLDHVPVATAADLTLLAHLAALHRSRGRRPSPRGPAGAAPWFRRVLR